MNTTLYDLQVYIYMYIYIVYAPAYHPPPGHGHGLTPSPSLWTCGGCGWACLLVFASGAESYEICKDFD